MPPRISPTRLYQPQSCQCFRTRPSKARAFHASPSHTTRLRRDMWKWLKGPGKVFRTTPAGSTNYLSAYDREGNLLRAKRGAEKVRNADIEDEDVAAERDLSTTELTEEEREQKKEERALRRAEYEEIEARGGVPKERQSDLRPYPLNQNFRSQPVLCEELREQVYYLAVHQGFDLSSLAATFQMDVRRVAAVVRLKTIEKKWVAEGKRLASPYADAVLAMLPQTPFRPGTKIAVTPHEPVNDLPVHPRTRQQLFYPASESRQFTREDAAKAFDNNLLPADKRIPVPWLVDREKWILQGLSREERQQKQRELDHAAYKERMEKERRRAAWEERSIRIVPGRRWDFKFQDISAEKVGKDGRGQHAVGLRYGMPHEDRKRGMVKIPTVVD